MLDLDRPSGDTARIRRAVFIALAILGGCRAGCAPEGGAGSSPAPTSAEAEIRTACATHHAFPEPSILPRHHWDAKVEKMYKLPTFDPSKAPPKEAVAEFYRFAAPKDLPLLPSAALPATQPQWLARHELRSDLPGHHPGVAAVVLGPLYEAGHTDLALVDLRHGIVQTERLRAAGREVRAVARLRVPSSLALVDLDRDGANDLVAGELGEFFPSEAESGAVVWLRREGESFAHHYLVEKLPRVSDLVTADVDADGDADLAVAAAGHLRTGGILVLENLGGVDAERRPRLAQRWVDRRPGARAIRVADIDGNGRPDLIVVYGQKDEEVWAYLGRSRLEYDKKLLFAGPHPDYGLTGAEPGDLDGDGDVDLVLTNGDVRDTAIAKPYHGVRWLENDGPSGFRLHELAALPGAAVARIGDLDGDGDMDIVAGAFVPAPTAELRGPEQLVAVLWLEQVAAGKFEPRAIESIRADHVALALADVDHDGDLDLAVGNFALGPTMLDGLDHRAVLFENTRPRR